MDRPITTGFAAVALIATQLSTPLLAQITTQPYPSDRPYPDRYPDYGNKPGYGDNRGYAGRIRCESRKDRTEKCKVRTENRVVLVSRQGGTCTQGRSWGYDKRSIWVSRGCRGTFAYGYGNDWGNDWPEKDKDKGPSTGAIIAGVAVAGGLIALLANSGKKKDKAPAETAQPATPATPPTYPPGPPAAVSADLAGLPADAKPSMQTCLFEAARQIGVTGGSKLRYDKMVHIEPGNGGWRFRSELTATYPDGDRAVPMYCRATPTKVIQLDFTS